jgi:hypothetical protein
MMDSQTKKELKTLKIVAVGMPIMLCIVALFFGLSFWWAQKLSNPVVRILQMDGASATICGISIYDTKSVIKSFDDISSVKKTSGSSPLNLKFFIVESQDESHILQLGQDSRDTQLFWVYPEEGQLNTFVGGWINSKYMAERYADCK